LKHNANFVGKWFFGGRSGIGEVRNVRFCKQTRLADTQDSEHKISFIPLCSKNTILASRISIDMLGIWNSR
jgi:hypothetical protein